MVNDYESPTRNLTRGSSADLSFVVLQELDIVSNQLFADKILSNGLCQLMEKAEEPSRTKGLKNGPR